VQGHRKHLSGIEEGAKRGKEVGVNQNSARDRAFNLYNLMKEEEK
jgi:hypothetical protein